MIFELFIVFMVGIVFCLASYFLGHPIWKRTFLLLGSLLIAGALGTMLYFLSLLWTIFR